MTGAARAVAAALLIGIAVLVGAPRAFAASGVADARAAEAPAMLPPVIPAPIHEPDIGGLPCLPGLLCDPLGGLGAEAVHDATDAVFAEFGNLIADGLTSELQLVAADITQTTKVDLNSQWFESHADALRGLAVVILLPLMMVGLISAIIHRDASQLVRAGGVYVPVAIVGGVVAITLTATAINLTDSLTSAVTGDLGGNTDQALSALRSAIVAVSKAVAPGTGFTLAMLVMLILFVGAMLIWIELLLRTSAIYVVVLFLPIAMSGLVWRGTVHWTRRMIEILVALILSKFVIVVVIDLASGMITANDGVTTILQGATLLLLAALAPFTLLRLVPIVEAGVIGHLERMERRPLAVATRATAMVVSAVTGQVEAAAASQAIKANGGGGGAISQTITEGGELNNTEPPDDGTDTNPGPRLRTTVDADAGSGG